MEYIEPKTCPHFYHKNCKKNKCKLCNSFITSQNMNCFGIFFKKHQLKNIIIDTMNQTSNHDIIRTYFFDKIRELFEDIVEKNSCLDNSKKNKLKRIFEIRKKYNDNYRLFKYDVIYKSTSFDDIDINSDLDQIENNLDKEIKARKERKERKERAREIELSNNYDDNDSYDEERYNYNYNYQKNNQKISYLYFCSRCNSEKICFYCRTQKTFDNSMSFKYMNLQCHSECLKNRYFFCNKDGNLHKRSNTWVCKNCSIRKGNEKSYCLYCCKRF